MAVLKSYSVILIHLRRESVLRTSCCDVFDPEQEPKNLENRFELVIDAVGMETTRRMAIRAVRPGGVFIHIGLQNSAGDCDFRKITLAEITIIGTYTYTHTDLQTALQTLHSGVLGDLFWVEERPLSEGAEAFSDLNGAIISRFEDCFAPTSLKVFNNK